MYTILNDLEPDSLDILSNLPEEIFSYIFIHLEGGDLLTCRTVCKTWKNICEQGEIKKKIENYKKKISQDYRHWKENKTPSSVTQLVKRTQRLAFDVNVAKKLFNTSPVSGRLLKSPSPVPVGKFGDKSPCSRRLSPYLSPQVKNSSPRFGQFSSGLGSISEGVLRDNTFQSLRKETSPIINLQLSSSASSSSHRTEYTIPAIRLFESSPQLTSNFAEDNLIQLRCNAEYKYKPAGSIEKKQQTRMKGHKRILRRL